MSYKATRKNRVITISEEKAEEYISMGYTITDMDGNMIHEQVDLSDKIANLEKQVADLSAKLKEVTLYAENADKQIDELNKQIQELQEDQKDAAKKSVKTNTKA